MRERERERAREMEIKGEREKIRIHIPRQRFVRQVSHLHIVIKMSYISIDQWYAWIFLSTLDPFSLLLTLGF